MWKCGKIPYSFTYIQYVHNIMFPSRLNVYCMCKITYCRRIKNSHLHSPDGSSVLLDGVVGSAAGISTPGENKHKDRFQFYYSMHLYSSHVNVLACMHACTVCQCAYLLNKCYSAIIKRN